MVQFPGAGQGEDGGTEARDGCCIEIWSRRQESNLYLALRRHSFYPLNYGETRISKRWALNYARDYS
jgi:hypothetical protein